ncbi:MAG: sigma-70 family RNA polymerase sigma factor [Pirellulaceae bacterium]|jgi:RNA polymerase sigma-70 factor (ECF subfamily)|nr:sigma-70 family RNA polymerase sigma factor [Pirellulaceae bacterium]HJN11162.1 sigma-70 family RNA polymerase sigma factor [Pirellulaceae bacterium]
MADWVTPELLQTLLNRHGAALELFASQWTTSPDDCVQDAFIQLVRQTRSPDCVPAWLFRVVRNRAISMKRSAARRKRHELAASGSRPVWFTANRDGLIDAAALGDALRDLSDRHREVIVAKIWGGLSFEQIAKIVGTSRSSAHRRYEAGLIMLRKRLELSWLNESNRVKNSVNSSAT